ncbi:putative C2H2 finger domain protein, partial [Aspergillus ibericus CBS 121593]
RSRIAIRSPLLDPPDIAGGLSGSRYWSLASDPVAFPQGHLSSGLTTPSSLVVGDLFSSNFSRETSANLAALAIPPPGMGTALEALTTPQPLNSRRPAAPTLPSFELPAPTFPTSGPIKYAHHPNSASIHPSVSKLLTPPASTQSGDNGHASTAVTTGVSTNSELAPYWQGQGSYSASGAAAARQSWSSGMPYTSRDTFPLPRNPATSTPGTEHIPQPFEVNQLPPFQQPIPVSAAPGGPLQHHSMPHAMLSVHPLPNPAPSPHPLPSNDPYMVKSSSAPAYGTVQQVSNSPGYSSYGPTGLGMQQPPGRVASNPHPTHHLNYQRGPWPSYSLPAMNGPVWTNVHNPNGPMSVTGNQPGLLPGLPGFNSGHAANLQQMQQLYGGHPPHPGHGGPGPTNDRPFKCDQCPQSFNRNHDLKRHKRIHLSVKPFPCTHCDKSFSRKDALKRHILVKGCGKDGSDGLKASEHGSVKEEDRSDGLNGHH